MWQHLVGTGRHFRSHQNVDYLPHCPPTPELPCCRSQLAAGRPGASCAGCHRRGGPCLQRETRRTAEGTRSPPRDPDSKTCPHNGQVSAHKACPRWRPASSNPGTSRPQQNHALQTPANRTMQRCRPAH